MTSTTSKLDAGGPFEKGMITQLLESAAAGSVSDRDRLLQIVQAERDYEALLALSLPVLGEDHSYILMLRNNRASLLPRHASM